MLLYLPLICFAIGFSWSGFVRIFAASPAMSQSCLAQSTAASSIFLCALSLAFSDGGLITGAVLAVCGFAVAVLLGERLCLPWSILIAACSFTAYLYGTVG